MPMDLFKSLKKYLVLTDASKQRKNMYLKIPRLVWIFFDCYECNLHKACVHYNYYVNSVSDIHNLKKTKILKKFFL